MYRHLLLAVETDKDNQLLVAKAFELANQHQARLTLLHVVDFIPNDVGDTLALSMDHNATQQLISDARDELDELIQLAPESDQTRIDSHVSMGSARHEIVSTAEERKCDLIVIGHHRHHGLGRLLGHTDESVLHHAPCDVLAIHLD